jgi:hypothetical protein
MHNGQVTRVPHLHATNAYLSNTLAYKKNDIYNKNDIKITYTNKKTTKVETYPSPLTHHQEAQVSQDLYKSLSLHMGNPRSQGSIMTTTQKSQHRRNHWSFHHPVAGVILPIYI